MDICPRCKYEEPPIWKNRMWKLYQQYTTIDELESWDETRDLALTLKKIGPNKYPSEVTWSDGYYNYCFKEDGFVIRIAKKFARDPNTMLEPTKEKARLPPDRSQRTLADYGYVN